MINLEERQLLHQFIILDLAIRALQHDYEAIETLKMTVVYKAVIEALLKSLRSQHHNLKRQLQQRKIYIVRWHRNDMYFSDVQIATKGEDISLRYANQALKTEVEQVLLRSGDTYLH